MTSALRMPRGNKAAASIRMARVDALRISQRRRRRRRRRGSASNVVGSPGSNARAHSGQTDSGKPRKRYPHERHRACVGTVSPWFTTLHRMKTLVHPADYSRHGDRLWHRHLAGGITGRNRQNQLAGPMPHPLTHHSITADYGNTFGQVEPHGSKFVGERSRLFWFLLLQQEAICRAQSAIRPARASLAGTGARHIIERCGVAKVVASLKAPGFPDVTCGLICVLDLGLS